MSVGLRSAPRASPTALVGPTARWPLALLAVSVAVYLVHRTWAAPGSVDLAVYRATGAAVRDGASPYADLHLPDGLQATYPPFAALLFVPLAALSLGSLASLAVGANIILLVAACVLSCRLVAVPASRRVPTALVAAALCLLSEPVTATLDLGQIDLLLLVLVLADLARPDGAPLRGIGVGLAAAVKLTPAVFIGYLLLTRRYRDSAVAGAAFLSFGALAWIVLPGPSQRYWTRLLFDVRRIGMVERPDNQSVRGLLARMTSLADPGTGATVLTALIGGAGLAIAVLAHRRLGEAWGVMACGFTTLLVTPISWTHHWVWLVPAAVLLWVEARRWSAMLVVFWTYLVRMPPNRHLAVTRYPAWMTALSGAYAYVALAVLGLTLYRATRPSAQAAVPRPGSPTLPQLALLRQN